METNRWQSRGPSPRVNVPERPGKSAPRPRMLATLATGVKGGRWHSLIDKLHPVTTLRAAFAAVSANRGAAGVDRVTIERYASDLDGNLGRLSEALRTGTYRPQAIRRHYIPKLGSQELRPLGIPRCKTGWYRRRCAWCWNRSTSGTLPHRVTAFAPVSGARTRSDVWMSCSRRATPMWSMPI